MTPFRVLLKKILSRKIRTFLYVYISQIIDLMNRVVMWIPLQILRLTWFRLILGKAGSRVQLCRNVRIKGIKGIRVGANSFINEGVMLDGRLGIDIGENVDIGEFVKIWTVEHDPNDCNHECRGGKVIIEDHVWIAPWVIIMPGLTIGRGAVVAGGAIVTKDVPSKAIVAGVPAKVIGWRDNDLNYQLKHHQIF